MSNNSNCNPMDMHTHEFQGSFMLAEECDDRHNHRFAGVTGKAIMLPGGNHTHEFFTNSDFFDEHYHQLEGETGPGIPVGEGKHVHFARRRSTVDDEHFHIAQFATLIEDPLR